MEKIKKIMANMIVIDGMDGAGKGVQTRRLFDAMHSSGYAVTLTREPGGSKGAEEIRHLLVSGEPDRWDAMTELLLVYAARRSHLIDTVWPALENECWVISDRYADSSRAFQGVAGGLGLAVVEKVHQTVVGDFEPGLTIILDLPADIALARAGARGGGEDRFERKGIDYHNQVRNAFREIARTDPSRYVLIDGAQDMDQVTADVFAAVNKKFGCNIDIHSIVD